MAGMPESAQMARRTRPGPLHRWLDAGMDRLLPAADARRGTVGRAADAWSWERQLRLEQVAAYARGGLALLVAAGLALGLLPPTPAAYAATGALWLFAAADQLARRRHPALLIRCRWGSAAADLVLCCALVLATGGRSSPLTLLLPYGLVWQAHRLAPRHSLPGSAVYLVAYRWLGPAGGSVLDLWLLALLAGGLTLAALRRERLHGSSVRDPLTGTFSRSYGLLALQRLAQANQLPFCVLFLDLDGLKGVNDTLGHEAGDSLLLEAARLITGAVRTGDIVVRYGGDEFLVVLGEADAETAYAVASRIRQRIRAAHVPLRGQPTPTRVTVSCGVAEACRGQRVDDLLRLADQRLYKAKLSRDCVVVAGGEAPT